MDARVSLVTTVHEIAISTEFAITARASQEADTDTLTNLPALDARANLLTTLHSTVIDLSSSWA